MIITKTSTKTSTSHPLRIDTLPFGNGAIGLTFCPGKRQANALSGAWDRDLAMDLDAMAAWGCTEVISLVEPWELQELQVPHLGQAIEARGWRWHHWPIVDRDPPDHRFLHRWAGEEEALRQRLREGGRTVFTAREDSVEPEPSRRCCWPWKTPMHRSTP